MLLLPPQSLILFVVTTFQCCDNTEHTTSIVVRTKSHHILIFVFTFFPADCRIHWEHERWREGADFHRKKNHV